MRPWPRRKAPDWLGRQVLQRSPLSPVITAVLGNKESAWLSADPDSRSIILPLFWTYLDRGHSSMGDSFPNWSPGHVLIVATPESIVHRSTIDMCRLYGVDRQASRGVFEMGLGNNSPVVALPCKDGIFICTSSASSLHFEPSGPFGCERQC